MIFARTITLLALWTPCSAAPGSELYGRVVAIRDGDTIDVLDTGGTRYRVRLIGVDAPEKGQHFGDAATNALQRLAVGRSVKVEWKGRDRYRRLVGRVWYGSLDLGLEMLKLGLAWNSTGNAGRIEPDPEYATAEASARASKRGLWTETSPLPPWLFRRQGTKVR